MIISTGRGYIFVHIPKTGGTSMALALEARAQKDDILIGDTPKAKKRKRRLLGVKSAGRLWKHSNLRDIDGLVSGADMQRYFVFTLVRNPWDRLVSYYHWLQAQSFDHRAVSLAQGLDFSGFLNHAHTRVSLGAQSYGSYVTAPDGKDVCNLFIRLEHLAQDLPKLEAHLGFSLGELPRENASKRAEAYRGYYNDRDAALLGDICAVDIARFNYRFA